MQCQVPCNVCIYRVHAVHNVSIYAFYIHDSVYWVCNVKLPSIMLWQPPWGKVLEVVFAGSQSSVRDCSNEGRKAAVIQSILHNCCSLIVQANLITTADATRPAKWYHPIKILCISHTPVLIFFFYHLQYLAIFLSVLVCVRVCHWKSG